MTRTARIHDPQVRAVVLGSSQPPSVVDAGRAGARGLTVLRRRSGGGAVLVEPGDPVWVDVWVPRHDPLWREDVVAAAEWVGEWWAGTLGALGVPDVAVHRGAPVRTRWSSTVCFAGLAPGEVTVAGTKVVGVAQWRGKEGALFHSAAHVHWAPERLIDVLALDDEERAVASRDLATAAVGLEAVGGPGVAGRLSAELVARLAGPPWSVRRG
ncbi:MAG TPA: hypothetical protein VKG43_05855 [Acidimicrobiales bacterium]|nr:hypothetical protein [Acidimicrobiales bacterium]